MNVADDWAFSRVLVALFKNVVFKETDPEHWEVILTQKYKLEDYVSKIGLTLMVDEMDGYGYLKQRSYGEGEEEIPRLVPRHALSYPVSLHSYNLPGLCGCVRGFDPYSAADCHAAT